MDMMLPPAFGLVTLVVVAYCMLNVWMAMQVGMARKRYNVPYPAMYADENENKDGKLFNCVQRGHQNSLEVMPMFFVLLTFGGLQHPIAATVLGVIYCMARFLYFTGYSTGDPKRRLTYGRFNFLALVGLLGCSASFGVRQLLSGPLI
ncbi:uncharacterized protein LOC131044989 [Cryptomeria japonica]|uniref:uncharacterized protein LOC131044989 n=1 Tax=Cryptomeria japonica TaxID=3369 RepID=UPI0025ABB869|nr:uncharacterized protein LOC131044989 [Cryptomeria japonica]